MDKILNYQVSAKKILIGVGIMSLCGLFYCAGKKKSKKASSEDFHKMAPTPEEQPQPAAAPQS